VYQAYDVTLDRKLAVEVLRGDARHGDAESTSERRAGDGKAYYLRVTVHEMLECCFSRSALP
jgi:hypothetical protein